MLFYNIRQKTESIEPWWTLLVAPVVQEFIFRFLPYQLIYLPFGRYWEIGILTAFLFAILHWYFGKWFVVYAFLWGLALWWIMVNFGLFSVILVHALANSLHIYFEIIKSPKRDS